MMMASKRIITQVRRVRGMPPLPGMVLPTVNSHLSVGLSSSSASYGGINFQSHHSNAFILSRNFGSDAKKPKFSKVVPTIDEAIKDVVDGSMM
jgi:hypothetical protein